ncbi:MAG: class I SAM-dependent methyltransferase [Alphaproteobacteria bacterium]|nr:class I SAM-dependent methyltransferase [Alphaproteobacteria bacterium]
MYKKAFLELKSRSKRLTVPRVPTSEGYIVSDVKMKCPPDIAATMEYVACNLCGADNTEHLYEIPDLLFNKDHIFNVVQCRQCSLAYVNPRPTQQSIDYYYPKEFYDSFDHDPQHQQKRYETEAEYLKKYAPKVIDRPLRLLDVGCANGDFTRLMKQQGWDVEGVEIGSAAKEISDFNVYNTILPLIPITQPHYDMITAWAVLEHIHDPLSYFAKASQILNANGVFIFLVTNIDSLSSKRLFREDVPRHTYFYNRKTINLFLEKNGLEMLHAIDDSDIYEMRPVGWLSHYLNKIQGKPSLQWDQFPIRRHDWLAAKGLPPTPQNTLRYSLEHPIAALDRLSVPLFEKWQKMTATYGITTYIARKKPA